jgi:hypothetical protein
MVKFKGRSKHTTSIRNKPIREGHKGWAIADDGYLLKWLYHSRTHSTPGIPLSNATKASGARHRGTQLAPTQHVPWILVEPLRKLYPERTFALFLDNLFTSYTLLSFLRSQGIAACGTTKQRLSGHHPEVLDAELQEWGDIVAAGVEWTPENLPPPRSQASSSFLAPPKAPQRTIEPPRGPGDSRTALDEHSDVVSIKWRDQKDVYLMSTFHRFNFAPPGPTATKNTSESVRTLRKRPRGTTQFKKAAQRQFVGHDGHFSHKKALEVPLIIDQYNHKMNCVDRGDQLRESCTSFRRGLKDWRPIFSFLLDQSCTNAYKLHKWECQDHPRGQKLRSIATFKLAIAQGLWWSTPERDIQKMYTNTETTPVMNINLSQSERFEDHELVKTTPLKRRQCVDCTAAGQMRPKRRRALQEVDGNARSSATIFDESGTLKGTYDRPKGLTKWQGARPSRSTYECNRCKVALCGEPRRCFRLYHAGLRQMER